MHVNELRDLVCGLLSMYPALGERNDHVDTWVSQVFDVDGGAGHGQVGHAGKALWAPLPPYILTSGHASVLQSIKMIPADTLQ